VVDDDEGNGVMMDTENINTCRRSSGVTLHDDLR
jgi:hypothetical protein